MDKEKKTTENSGGKEEKKSSGYVYDGQLRRSLQDARRNATSTRRHTALTVTAIVALTVLTGAVIAAIVSISPGVQERKVVKRMEQLKRMEEEKAAADTLTIAVQPSEDASETE